MTCIVGLVDNGAVYLGGDSAATGGYERTIMTQPKVFQVGEAVIGGTGYLRLLQIVRYKFQLPTHPVEMESTEYLATLFFDALRKCLQEVGHTQKDGDREGFYGALLVGYRGKLYEIAGDYAVLESTEPWFAIGSGSEYATGSLHTTAPLNVPPEQRVRAALAAAATYNLGCAAPFTVLRLDSVETPVPVTPPTPKAVALPEPVLVSAI